MKQNLNQFRIITVQKLNILRRCVEKAYSISKGQHEEFRVTRSKESPYYKDLSDDIFSKTKKSLSTGTLLKFFTRDETDADRRYELGTIEIFEEYVKKLLSPEEIELYYLETYESGHIVEKRVIVFTGLSGINIDKELRRYIAEFPIFNESPEKKPAYFKVETEIEKIYRVENPHTRDSRSNILWIKILSLPYSQLEEYWKKAMNYIVGEIKRIPEESVFVNLHACYFHPRTQEYLSLISLELLKNLKPLLFVTLIDDIYDIHHRLSSNHHGIFYEAFESVEDEKATRKLFNYFRIMEWRAKEIMMSRFIAKQFSCKNVVFAAKHSWHTLYTLTASDNYKTAYLSHPISEVRKLENRGELDKANEIKHEIRRIGDELGRKGLVMFLPTTIDEFRIKREPNTPHYYRGLSPRWEMDKYESLNSEMLYTFSGFTDSEPPWNPPKMELEPQFKNLLTILSNAISLQVTIRDYILVEQSDIVVTYRPLYNGAGSGGVREENKYHYDLEKALEKEMEQKRINHRRRFTYCPQEDINLFIKEQFNSTISEFIQSGHFTCIQGKEFKSITPAELDELIKSDKNTEMLLETFRNVMNNHGIKIIDEKGIANPYPLGNPHLIAENMEKEVIDKFIKRILLISFYKDGAELFSTDGTFDGFIDKLYNRLES